MAPRRINNELWLMLKACAVINSTIRRDEAWLRLLVETRTRASGLLALSLHDINPGTGVII
ncbi:hypothetical protein H7H82_07710 [Mycobacterium heidelbergense]|uniref:Uncharacterized protein n=1 Tax=Mycobacterium heidelbergense TaxID=53376 RepID=A0A1X0DC60_MYCHE|nr:hypothetical protein [Mycobacterium heidelbergense]MCV7050482.1 hypothetical protein [Mycobacterium heidelbergense]ORA69985.1 hypothetical protein BST25_20245 [Mycobacterium heidelbergense]BBZ52160.1 hypothetical protein MHEI_38770 [Mycobacterium heidelbergense]